MRRLRLVHFFCVAAAVVGLKTAAHAEIVAWSPSSTDAGAIRARLKIDARDIDLDLRVIKPSASPRPAPLLVETGKGDAFVPVATLRNMTTAKIDLSTLSEDQRVPALIDLITKLKKDSGAAHVLAHGDATTSALLITNAALFDGLLLENTSAASLPKTLRVITLFDAEGLARLNPDAMNRKSALANQRRFYLAGASLASPSADTSCKTLINAASADPARRALLVMLEDWLRGVSPPPSRFPNVADLTLARLLNWPKIPNLPPPPADDRPAVKIDLDGNETSGLCMPDQALPVATFVSFNAQRDKSGKPCAGGVLLPFPAMRAAREASNDPRLSLMERYGSRAYFVATLRVIADKLVREKLLLPQDADAYVAAGKVAPF